VVVTETSSQDITTLVTEGVDAVNDFIREAEHDWYESVHKSQAEMHKSQAQPHTVIEP
jgi:hypothetical protein